MSGGGSSLAQRSLSRRRSLFWGRQTIMAHGGERSLSLLGAAGYNGARRGVAPPRSARGSGSDVAASLPDPRAEREEEDIALSRRDHSLVVVPVSPSFSII